MQLGNIGLEIKKKDGSFITAKDIDGFNQGLDMWTGIITSLFVIEGEPVKVTTVAHQQRDAVSFRIESQLLADKRIMVRLRFPYPNGQWKDVGNNWLNNEKQFEYCFTK